MTAVPKKLVVDQQGLPVEIIISWADYQENAERLGWDLAADDLEDLREARRDWVAGDPEAFVPH